MHKFKVGPEARRFNVGDPYLAEHVEQGSPVALFLQDDITVLDIEAPHIHEYLVRDAARSLPQTLTVMSGGGGLHYYYRVPGWDTQTTLGPVSDPDDAEHWGDLKASGKGYVVVPPSPHKSGRRYKVVADLPIATVDEATWRHSLWHLGIPDMVEVEEDRRIRAQADLDRTTWHDMMTRQMATAPRTMKGPDAKLVLARLPSLDTMIGHRGTGPHPVHGSGGGHNLSVDDRAGKWYCHRCGSGGGPLEWVAVQAGLIRCDQAKKGCLRGKLFKQTLQIAVDTYHIGV